MFQPVVAPVGVRTRIGYIANDPEKARMEIIALRERERKLKTQLRQKVIVEELESNGYHVSGQQLRRTHQAVQIMDEIIENAGLNDSQRELWEMQRD